MAATAWWPGASTCRSRAGTKVVDGYTLVGHHPVVPNAVLQAYCHPVVTNNDLWIAGVGWGIGFLVLGIIFFWQAESKYGRG